MSSLNSEIFILNTLIEDTMSYFFFGRWDRNIYKELENKKKKGLDFKYKPYTMAYSIYL